MLNYHSLLISEPHILSIFISLACRAVSAQGCSEPMSLLSGQQEDPGYAWVENVFCVP
jgi:hypothetical protein